MRHLAMSILVAAAAVATAACSTQNLLAGGLVAAQSLFVSQAQVAQLGQETKIQVLAETPEYPNPTVKAYLTALGQRLVAQSGSKLTYEWYVVDSTEPNAFAAPGGFVFVTTAALRMMQNEAQLAGVVGHEIAHVVKEHSLNGIRTTMIAQGAVTAALGQTPGELAKVGANIAANLILKHSDRNQELEADQLGADYAYGLGYDPRALGAFLTALSAGGETTGWATWFSDHPGSSERQQKLNEHFTMKGWQLDGKTLGADSYQTEVLSNLTNASSAPKASATPGPV